MSRDTSESFGHIDNFESKPLLHSPVMYLSPHFHIETCEKHCTQQKNMSFDVLGVLEKINNTLDSVNQVFESITKTAKKIEKAKECADITERIFSMAQKVKRAAKTVRDSHQTGQERETLMSGEEEEDGEIRENEQDGHFDYDTEDNNPDEVYDDPFSFLDEPHLGEDSTERSIESIFNQETDDPGRPNKGASQRNRSEKTLQENLSTSSSGQSSNQASSQSSSNPPLDPAKITVRKVSEAIGKNYSHRDIIGIGRIATKLYEEELGRKPERSPYTNENGRECYVTVYEKRDVPIIKKAMDLYESMVNLQDSLDSHSRSSYGHRGHGGHVSNTSHGSLTGPVRRSRRQSPPSYSPYNAPKSSYRPRFQSQRGKRMYKRPYY